LKLLYNNKPAGEIMVSASLSQGNEDGEQWPEVVEEFVISPRIDPRKTIPLLSVLQSQDKTLNSKLNSYN
jgi:hypothetical protein